MQRLPATMSSIALLIPLALLFFIGIVGILVWSVKSGQFDDLESPATEILLDRDKPANPPPTSHHTPPHD